MKRTRILFPAAFLMNMNLALINFAVIFYLKDSVDIGPSVIGWFFAVGSGSYVIGCLLYRKIQNRILPPVSMFFSIFLTAISVFMMVKVDKPALVLLFYAFFSVAPAFYWPQLVGWFSYGLDDRSLGRTISKFNISWSTGALTGPLIGGFLVEQKLLLPFYTDIAMMAVLALLIAAGMVFLPEMREFPDYSVQTSKEEQGKGMINEGRGTVLRFAGWIGVFSTYIVLGLINNIFPLFIRDTLGLGESTAGNILFVRGITTALGFFLAGKLVFWHFNSRVMIITQIATAILMLMLLLVRSVYGFYVLFIFYGLLFSMAYSNGIFHGSAGASDRGPRMALFESFLTMGVITGSVAGGYFYQYFSIQAAFIFCSVFISAGLAAQIVILRFRKIRGIK